MKFRVLGPLEVSHDQTTLPLGGPKQRAVLAVLLAHAQSVVSADRLIDEVWGGSAPTSARRTLHSFVSNLRRLVNADRERLAGRDTGYVIDVDQDEVDALAFSAAVEAGSKLLDADAAAAAARLRQALELWRGTPYSGLPHDAPSLAQETVRLEETRMTAVEALNEARLRLGEHRLLIPHLRDLVSEYPLREHLRGQLMLALHRAGRSTDALRTFQEGRRILGEQLGTEPGRALQDLEQAILIHDEQLELAEVAGPPAWPRYMTSLIGRRREIPRLRQALTQQRLITLVGPPGVGKTRLAAEAAQSIDRPAAKYWVDLAGLEAAEEVVGRVAHALSIPETIGVPRQRLIVGRLREQETLLVLDNCEQVIEGAAQLAQLVLGAVDHVGLLATSREPLRVDGEYIMPVEPLAIPDQDAPGWDDLIDADAMALFAARAEAATGGSVRIEAARDLARDIVAKLDGLPLAIELAAARLRSISLQDLNLRLEDRFRVLVDAGLAARPHQHSLEAALATSYGSLSPEEQDLLGCLAVFRTSFDPQAAVAVATAVDRDEAGADAMLGQLVNRSLLAADTDGNTRYRMLESVRHFAFERTDAGVLEAAHRRLCDHFLARAREVSSEMLGPSIGAWLDRTRADHDNYLAAIRWALDNGSADTALGICASLAPFWYRTSFLTTGRALLDDALTDTDPRGESFLAAVTARAWLAYAAGDPNAVGFAREAVELAEATGGLSDRVATLEGLAGALIDADEAAAGLEAAATALGLAHELGAPEAIAIAEQMMGLGRRAAGDLDEAAEYLMSARDRIRGYRIDVDAGWILVQLGETELERGNAGVAIENAEAAVRDFGERGDPKGTAAALLLQGRALRDRDPPRARAALEQAATVSERWGDEAAQDRARAVLDTMSAGRRA